MSASPPIAGTCHCGKATIRLARRPDSVTQCNCSLCVRTGFCGIYYPSDEVDIAGEFDSYIRDDQDPPMLRTLRCVNCGIATHWEPLSAPPHARMGINARLFDPALLESVEVREVDGASW